jgi:GNAT superfamily N-acetyltransferase
MLDRWFFTIKLPLTLKQFHQLPQNPAFKYEYLEKNAWLSPRPKFYSARLALPLRESGCVDEIDARGPVGFRRLMVSDWPRMSRLFAGSFHRVQPFSSLSDRRRLEAARACLKHTRQGGDGPLIESVCHVAFNKESQRLVGAIIVTLIPLIDLDDFWSMQWKSPPPPDSVENHLGRPHLTWIFVGPLHAGLGIGTALLAHATSGLIKLGYTELVSSFVLGNTSSMLWHWRTGFELLPYVGSLRRRRSLLERAKPKNGPSGQSDTVK